MSLTTTLSTEVDLIRKTKYTDQVMIVIDMPTCPVAPDVMKAFGMIHGAPSVHIVMPAHPDAPSPNLPSLAEGYTRNIFRVQAVGAVDAIENPCVERSIQGDATEAQELVEELAQPEKS